VNSNIKKNIMMKVDNKCKNINKASEGSKFLFLEVNKHFPSDSGLAVGAEDAYKNRCLIRRTQTDAIVGHP
jgi:hypothetical protein